MRLDERRGLAEPRPPAGPLVWLHGASVGEAAVADAAGRAARQRRPPRAGHHRHRHLGAAAGAAPAAAARCISSRRSTRRDSCAASSPIGGPISALIAESEIWPNMILEARRAGAPLAMVNARMSARSYARWRRAPGFIARAARRGSISAWRRARPTPSGSRALGARDGRGRRQSEIRRAAAAGRPAANSPSSAGLRLGPADLDRRLDPRRRGAHRRRGASPRRSGRFPTC